MQLKKITGKPAENLRKKPLEEMVLRAARLDAWKEQALLDERNFYEVAEVNANGGKRPNRGEDALIGVLIRNKIIPKKDYERMLRGELYTGPGMGLEIDPERLEIKVKRTKPAKKSKEADNHPMLEDADPEILIADIHPNGLRVFRTDKAHGHRVKAEKQRKQQAKAKLKSNDWKNSDPAVQAIAEALGLFDEASQPRVRTPKVWTAKPPQAQSAK
jgi:hypothetical protein